MTVQPTLFADPATGPLPAGQCLACEIEAQIADMQHIIDTLRRTLDLVDHVNP